MWRSMGLQRADRAVRAPKEAINEDRDGQQVSRSQRRGYLSGMPKPPTPPDLKHCSSCYRVIGPHGGWFGAECQLRSTAWQRPSRVTQRWNKDCAQRLAVLLIVDGGGLLRQHLCDLVDRP